MMFKQAEPGCSDRKASSSSSIPLCGEIWPTKKISRLLVAFALDAPPLLDAANPEVGG